MNLIYTVHSVLYVYSSGYPVHVHDPVVPPPPTPPAPHFAISSFINSTRALFALHLPGDTSTWSSIFEILKNYRMTANLSLQICITNLLFKI